MARLHGIIPHHTTLWYHCRNQHQQPHLPLHTHSTAGAVPLSTYPLPPSPTDLARATSAFTAQATLPQAAATTTAAAAAAGTHDSNGGSASAATAAGVPAYAAALLDPSRAWFLAAALPQQVAGWLREHVLQPAECWQLELQQAQVGLGLRKASQHWQAAAVGQLCLTA